MSLHNLRVCLEIHCPFTRRCFGAEAGEHDDIKTESNRPSKCGRKTVEAKGWASDRFSLIPARCVVEIPLTHKRHFALSLPRSLFPCPFSSTEPTDSVLRFPLPRVTPPPVQSPRLTTPPAANHRRTSVLARYYAFLLCVPWSQPSSVDNRVKRNIPESQAS